MKNISVVIGANYGDEGKGIVTDFLSHKYGERTAVVRYNGGSQAGHTVVLPKTHFRHIFQHLGCGTLNGCPTILGREFIVNPMMFWSEVFDLIGKLDKEEMNTILPDVFIDPQCRISTPVDMFINVQLEKSRAGDRHGSCGVGIGETIERNERGFPLTFQDLVDGTYVDKYTQIKEEYYPLRMEELGLTPEDLDDTIESQFLRDSRDIARVAGCKADYKAVNLFDNIVFEGAQGLCLDQNSKDFPHVTRSDTGLKNVVEILRDVRNTVDVFDTVIDIHYVSRIYNTRHGAGPLTNEIPFDEFTNTTLIKDRTNVLNDSQGQLRYAILDYTRLRNDINTDLEHINDFDYLTTACVTHCDQTGQVFHDTSVNDAVEPIKDAMQCSDLLLSFGRTRSHIIEINYEFME